MAPPLDHAVLSHKATLFLRRQLSATAAELTDYLGVSQPTLHRVLKETEGVMKVGRARAAKYVLQREIGGLATPVPVYQILVDGREQYVGSLQPISSEGFYFEGADGWRDLLTEGLPFFIEDIRPQGFLGYLLHAEHPELHLPKRVEDWSVSQILTYLSTYGSNAVGNIIIGRDALLRARRQTEELLSLNHTPEDYPQMAARQLQSVVGGSSVGGEQPKFLSVRNRSQFIVKYSPPLDQDAGRRWGDLLVTEYHALKVLGESGLSVAEGEIHQVGKQIFLEVNRFDRCAERGRKGVLSLAALDGEFVGEASLPWPELVRRLYKAKQIPSQDILDSVRKVYLFGQLIGNSDMHNGNLSFMHTDLQVTTLAPIYDMTAMLYAPISGQVIEGRELVLGKPLPEDRARWVEVAPWAEELWRRVAEDTGISDAFRTIAEKNAQRLIHLADLL